MHNTVTGPILDKWEIFVFKVQFNVHLGHKNFVIHRWHPDSTKWKDEWLGKV